MEFFFPDWKRPFTTERLTGVDKPLDEQASGSKYQFFSHLPLVIEHFSPVSAFGFFWGWVNVAVWLGFFRVAWKWWDNEGTNFANKCAEYTMKWSPRWKFRGNRRHQKYQSVGSETSSLSEKETSSVSDKVFEDIPNVESYSISEKKSKGSVVPNLFRASFSLLFGMLHLFVFLPLCIVMCVAPFIFPFVEQSIKWNVCNPISSQMPLPIELIFFFFLRRLPLTIAATHTLPKPL
jgi:hypothetical protein